MASEFSLVKWYMDCVTGRGDAVILYCAELRWRAIHITYSSVLSVLAGAIDSRSSMAGYGLESSGGRILVEFPKLKVSGQWQEEAAPVERAVYENGSGAVVWNCLQPKSRVNVRVGERELSGAGYGECLTLTLPPWQLPMRQLRWGRFVSPDDSLAWVDWQGEYATRFAFHNGRECEVLAVSDCEVAIAGAALRMEESFSLRGGRLGATILPGAPALGRLLPGSLFNIEEQKWRSRGRLTAEGKSSEGWAIHEVVHWKL